MGQRCASDIGCVPQIGRHVIYRFTGGRFCTYELAWVWCRREKYLKLHRSSSTLAIVDVPRQAGIFAGEFHMLHSQSLTFDARMTSQVGMQEKRWMKPPSTYSANYNSLITNCARIATKFDSKIPRVIGMSRAREYSFPLRPFFPTSSIHSSIANPPRHSVWLFPRINLWVSSGKRWVCIFRVGCCCSRFPHFVAI